MYNRLYKLSKIRSRQGLYEFLEREFASILSKQSVLTIGSGGDINRLLYKFAGHTSFEVVSLDIDEDRKPDIIGDIHDYDFGNHKFDVVVICEVLEHLYAPHKALANIHSILKPGGKLILSTPFVFPIHDEPYDYYRFTKYGLKYLLSDYRNVEISERNTFFETIDVLWVRLLMVNSKNSFKVSRIVIPFIYYFKRPLTKLLDRLVKSDRMTTGYVVTAIK